MREIKETGAVAAVSVTPARTKRLAPIAVEAGADIIVVQSTVTTARHISNSFTGLRLNDLVRDINVPVIVGNTVTASASLELMEQDIDGILVGVGPGALPARRATSPASACRRCRPRSKSPRRETSSTPVPAST